MKYGTKPTAVDAKGIVRIWTNDGILPERSVFVSGQLDGGFEWLEESVRVADILLHKLAKNKGLQDDGLVRILTGPDSDPYLQAYAAAILVRSVTDPRLDEPFPHKVYPDQERHLSSLMEQLSEYRAFPDVLCLKWRYSRASGSEGRFSYANFEFPPMLEYCWRCVSSYSLEVVGSHPSRRVMAAAAEAALTSSPWLVWSARAARRVSRDYRPADVTHVDDLGKNIEQVATRVKKITHGSTMISYDGFSVAIPRAALANLSGTTVEIANAAVAAMRSRGHLLEPHVLASSVAFATGTPAEYLSSQVTRAISELEDAERTWPAEKMDAGY
ncbi:MAG: hypothetical protein HZT39_02875 [Pseudoxanthomonas sp.]|nr:MAG: hypothetical protein HZT39_02875 [Pseudoxanthomonas sp.]